MSAVVQRLTGRLLVVDGGPGPWRRRVGWSDGDVRFGAADDRALAILNTALGNPWHTPALELAVGPLVLRATAPLTFACDGSISIDQEAQAPSRTLRLERGQTAQIAPTALCATIAVAGGVDAMPGTLFTREAVVPLAHPDRRITADLADLDQDDDAPLRVVAGPERSMFPNDAWSTLLTTTWRVSPQSSRQGVRLEGPALPVPTTSVPTSPTWTGAVQVPPAGQPIVLGVDSRTTGGYPRLAHVIAVDRFRLGRARPGSALRFTATTLDEARALRQAFAARWQR